MMNKKLHDFHNWGRRKTGKPEPTTIQFNAPDEILRLEANGKIFWSGREVKGDDMFRDAIMDLYKRFGGAIKKKGGEGMIAMDDSDTIVLVTTLVVILLTASFLLGANFGVQDTGKTAAQTECARYHPESGEFEWIVKKEIKE